VCHSPEASRLSLDQENKAARNEFPASGSSGFTSQRHGGRPNPPPSYPPKIQAHGIQFHQSCLMVVGGRQDLNLQLPSPEACRLRYLLEYRANIFVRNFVLSTKSTLVGGQLGGLFPRSTLGTGERKLSETLCAEGPSG
jgi:hypothetical protein